LLSSRLEHGGIALPATIALLEITMRKTIISALGVLLIAGSAALIASASARPVHRAASEQFRDSSNSVDGSATTFCSREPGNPYNPDTDYMGWSAWRAHGAWDSRNDCQ
jgi:hypothetical protein